MWAITPRLVDEVWREIVGYPPDRVQAEAETFLATMKACNCRMGASAWCGTGWGRSG